MKKSVLPLLILSLSQPAAANALTPEALVQRGLEAGIRYPGLADICDLSRPLLTAGRRPQNAQQRPQPTQQEREQRAAAAIIEPQKVFDNLFFLGTRGVASWVLRTSEGLIVIDALNNDKESQQFIEGGLRKLGLDPGEIRYLIITHSHGDHYGGQKYLVETYKPKVVMSEEDWQELEKPELQFSNPRWGVPPKRDVSIKDGERLTLGDTTVQLYVTPGHTPGTVSIIFPVQDGAETHMVALWGGTGLNFGPNEARMRAYAASASRFRDIAEKQSVDIFMSNHPARDGALESMEQLSARKSGQPHPFVSGRDALGAFQLLTDCALAQAESIKAGDRQKTP
ncbi:MBL fold metallo-hydrolase [Rhizobium sp. FKY42]|uniref:MBL fold metallo-hydrolase n=1 Tax=Rhizobium sp. FKY42 TaxID=2562310 RepID=UPI0010C09FF3|nr:MBL fold metallo-hydrolase [Rhizobium sp. FKY42]